MGADKVSVDGMQVPTPVSPSALAEADFATGNPEYNSAPRNADRVGGEQTFDTAPRTTEDVSFNGSTADNDNDDATRGRCKPVAYPAHELGEMRNTHSSCNPRDALDALQRQGFISLGVESLVRQSWVPSHDCLREPGRLFQRVPLVGSEVVAGRATEVTERWRLGSPCPTRAVERVTPCVLTYLLTGSPPRGVRADTLGDNETIAPVPRVDQCSRTHSFHRTAPSSSPLSRVT